MDFLEKLDSLMEKRNLNKSTLSKACNIPYTTIDGWYKKGYEGLKLTTLRKLADFFETSLDYWATGNDAQTKSICCGDSVNERLKDIRKSLGLTQAEFGETIGLKPTAIGQMESGTRNVVDRTLILLQEKHNVNIEYLKEGIGEKFIKPSTFSLDEYAKMQNLGKSEINLIRGFMELDSNTRNALYDVFKKAFSIQTDDIFSDVPKTSEELEKMFPPVLPKNNNVV